MKNAILSLLDSIAALLGPLSPFAKAVVPAVLAVAVVVVNAIFTGGLDSADLTKALSLLVAAIVTFLIPNKPSPTK